MEWGDLAKQVILMGAPMLGSALGGPLGGVAGEILAKAVGSVTITPAAVQSALPAADPAKLAEAETQWAEMIRAEAETQRIAISETQAIIRAEIESNISPKRLSGRQCNTFLEISMNIAFVHRGVGDWPKT